jgi:hypothetical protein
VWNSAVDDTVRSVLCANRETLDSKFDVLNVYVIRKVAASCPGKRVDRCQATVKSYGGSGLRI